MQASSHRSMMNSHRALNPSVGQSARILRNAAPFGQKVVRTLPTTVRMQKNLLRQKNRKRPMTSRKRQPKGRPLRSKVGSTLTPSRRAVWLEYVSELGLTTTGTGKNSYAYPIYTNGAFAVDPSSPTGFTTTPGFSVLATNYAAYRVKAYKGSITFSNTFAVSGSTVVCHSNSALGAPSGGTATVPILQYAANRPTINTVRPIAATGNGASQVTHTFSHTISAIAGESINQPGYKCLTNTVPSILTYIVFGWFFSTAVSNATMTVNVKLKMLVEFLDYIDTLTSFQTEEERLKTLGTPASFQPCAGCRQYQTLEAAPCPDPECHCIDKCTNCGSSRKCIAAAQSPLCPWRAELATVIPPVLAKANSRTLLKGQ
jgi:hypothetical protein